jgi:hypothetical protein
MAANVPATICSRFYNAPHWSSLAIGNNYYPPKADGSSSFYWFTVVNLNDLSVPDVAIMQNTTTVPANIAKYLGNSQFFLFFAANCQMGYNAPAGDLYNFLKQVGSGPQLDRGEQMIEQLGTGSITNFSYALAATFTTEDLPGFEVFSPDVSAILTMQFMPITVNGQTVYAPIQAGTTAAGATSQK